MRLRRLGVLVAAVLALAAAAPAQAGLLIQIDKASQRMTVTADGALIHTWPVSTGIARYDTPNGAFTPFRMERDHFSKEWDDAPMPYSIFFTKKGHAIHGTNHTSIGQPASHGCVRLSVAHAAALWGLVQKYKMANTAVVLTGEIPEHAAPAVAQRNAPAAIHEARGAGDETADNAELAPPPRYYAPYGGGRYVYREPPRYYYAPPPPRYYRYYRAGDDRMYLYRR